MFNKSEIICLGFQEVNVDNFANYQLSVTFLQGSDKIGKETVTFKFV